MRIAISGASGTGKTTIARALSEHYQIPLNPIGSRSVSEAMGFASPYDVDKAGRRAEFQRRLFEEKRDWEAKHDSFVSDRCCLDNLTYSLLHCAEELPAGVFDEYFEAMRRYDVVFVCEMRGFQDLNDPARSQSHAYHVAYELLFMGLLEEEREQHGVGLRIRRPLKSTVVTERVAECIKRIDSVRSYLACLERAILEGATP